MHEWSLLAKVYEHNAELPASVTLPPGDDMGGLSLAGNEVLVTVDQVADGVHVDVASTPIEKIGRKAITRNLSDVAAMGAVPAGAVVAAALPRSLGQSRTLELFHAMRRTAAEFGCPLFGGDVCIWDHPLLLSVTVLAQAAGVEPVKRAGAKAGDIICVTGSLGGSLENMAGRIHHLDFEPRLKVGRALAADPVLRPRCMLDLSDGLASDVRHLCRSAADGAALGAELWEEHLPITAAARQAAERDHEPLWKHALGDGEDYELCFVLSPEQAERLPKEIQGVSVSKVGVMTPASQPASLSLRKVDGSLLTLGEMGWEHRG